MSPIKAKPAVAAAGRAPRNGLFRLLPYRTTTFAEVQDFPSVLSQHPRLFERSFHPQTFFVTGRDPPSLRPNFHSQSFSTIRSTASPGRAPGGLIGCVIMPSGGHLLTGKIQPKKRPDHTRFENTSRRSVQALAWLLVHFGYHSVHVRFA